MCGEDEVRPHFVVGCPMVHRRVLGSTLKMKVAGEVLRGDAYDLVRDLDPESVDLVLTSPPYWGLRSYGLQHDQTVLDKWTRAGCHLTRTPPYDWYRAHGGILGLEPFPAWYIDHLVELFNRLIPALTPYANAWVNLGDTYFGRWSSIRDEGRQGIVDGHRIRRRSPSGGYLHDKQLLLLPSRFAIAMQANGWILRNDLIWSKGNVSARRERDRLRLSHEHFFHFVRRTPGARPTYYYDIREAEKGARDVITHSPQGREGVHTASFPPEVIRPRILTSCPPAGLVLDPFCGTGTTVLEALRTGRRAIGFELSAEYAALAGSAVAKASSKAG